MLRIADIVILTLVWLFVIGLAVRWALSQRGLRISGISARVPIAAVAFVAIVGGAFFLGLVLRGNNRTETAAPGQTSVPSAPPAQPMLFPTLDSLKMLGASTGEIRIVPGPGQGVGGPYPAKTDLVLTGWIADPAKTRSGDAFLVIDGRFRYPGITVDAAAPRGGFALALPLDRVAVGDHYVQAAMRASNGSGFYLLPAKVTFTVVE